MLLTLRRPRRPARPLTMTEWTMKAHDRPHLRIATRPYRVKHGGGPAMLIVLIMGVCLAVGRMAAVAGTSLLLR